MGRPRSESSRQAVIAAVRELLTEGDYDKLRIDSIVARSGVGRQTLYRWWRSKAAIVADAVLDSDAESAEPIPDSGDIRADLTGWLTSWAYRLGPLGGSQLVLALTSAASEDADVAGKLYVRFTELQERAVLERLKAARGAGQIEEGRPIEIMPVMLLGAIVFRVINRQEVAAGDDVAALINALLPDVPTLSSRQDDHP